MLSLLMAGVAWKTLHAHFMYQIIVDYVPGGLIPACSSVWYYSKHGQNGSLEEVEDFLVTNGM